ncbi:MAG: histidine kinase dimerization/phospho-acceptor domain-containing protein [Bacteroidota bacterium]
MALLYSMGTEGRLRTVESFGAVPDGAPLAELAEGLGDQIDVIDVSGAVPGARFAAGTRLGQEEGALLVLAPEDRQPDAAWTSQFENLALVALGLVRAEERGPDRTPVLYEIAVYPGTFEDRLAHALDRAARSLDLDAAVFALIEDGVWTPYAVHDPTGAVASTSTLPLDQTYCSITCRSHGAVGFEDGRAVSLSVSEPPAYLGAPVFVDGRCVGTFCVMGGTPRPEPFSPDDRALVEALARWVGVAYGSREAARQLAAREADLASFFNGSRMGMGTVRLVEPDDFAFMAVNAASASAFGSTPEALKGKRASRLDLDPDLVRAWVTACRRADQAGRPHRVEVDASTTRGTRVLATTVAAVERADPPRFTFMVEDVTDRRTGRAPALEGMLAQLPGALFVADASGRFESAWGRDARAIGLVAEHALGRPLRTVFSETPDAIEAIRAAQKGQQGGWMLDVGGNQYAVRVSPRRDRTGNAVGLVGIAIDGAALGAIASSEARSAFLQHLNYELRSPLTAVLGYAELLSEDAAPEEVARVRDVIIRSGERLLGALDDLDDLMLLDEPDVSIHPCPTDVVALVTSVIDATRPVAEARRLQLNVWCTLPSDPLLVDGGLLERMARHLIGAAVASSEGPSVDIRLEADGDDWLRLVVGGGGADGGLSGIGPHLIKRLVSAMGGLYDEQDPTQWVVRLPRQRVPMVSLDSLAEVPGEVQAMAAVPEAG